MKLGPKNLITDVAGLQVGNAHDSFLKSGTTVLTADEPFTASVDVMGGAPGTRETDCLDPDRLVESVDALVLSGGSALGLDAASGVADELRSQGRGFAVGPAIVPIVPAAILFDLLNGGDKNWKVNPYRQLGVDALADCSTDFDLGTAGAGVGATTGTLKGGLGSASIVLDNGVTVGALVAVNPTGSAVVPDHPNFWASAFEVEGEFGGLGPAAGHDPLVPPRSLKMEAFEAAGNTTIAIVATDAALSKTQLKRMAVAAQDGMARAIVPSHTPFDGDLIFSVSTGAKAMSDPISDPLMLGHVASICLARAIARGVFHATSEANDLLPTWGQTYSGGNQGKGNQGEGGA